MLRVNRLASVAFALIVLLLAYAFSDVPQAMRFSWKTVPLMGIAFFLGVLWRRANRYGAAASFLVALAAMFHVSPVNDPNIKAIIQANTLRIELVKKIFLLETITTEQLRKELANGRVDTTGPYPTTAVLLHALLPFRVILPSPVKSSGKAQAFLAMASSSTGQRRLGDI